MTKGWKGESRRHSEVQNRNRSVVIRKDKSCSVFASKLHKTNSIVKNPEQLSNFKTKILAWVDPLMKKWQKKFPNEGVNAEYMENIIDMSLGQANISGRAMINFVDANIKRGNFVTSSKRFSKGKVSRRRGGCFYNALDAMHEHKKKNPNMKLAIGTMIEKDVFTKLSKGIRSTNPFTLHSFIVENEIVFDPTMGKNNEYYVYQIVPDDVWVRFYYKSNDDNFDSREFVDYIEKEINKYN